MSDSYAVIVFDPDSDFLGVDEVYGPFDYDEANYAASILAVRMGVLRGEHVQVTMLKGLVP